MCNYFQSIRQLPLANATVIMDSALTTILGSTLTMHSTLHALPALQDNVIWIWVRGDEAAVVDPAESDPVQEWLIQRGLRLSTVLQTHHHMDHIGGTPALLRRWPEAAVVAAEAAVLAGGGCCALPCRCCRARVSLAGRATGPT